MRLGVRKITGLSTSGLAVLLLAGCLSLPSSGTSNSTRLKVIKEAQLAEGKIGFAAPEGYCVDPESFWQDESGGFALLASCVALTGMNSGHDVEPAILTVTAVPQSGAPVTANADVFEDVLKDEQVVSRVERNGVTLVKVRKNRSVAPGSGTQYWRGVLSLNGYVVGLAVYGAPQSTLSGPAGQEMLFGLSNRIKRASPEIVFATSPQKAAQESDQATRLRPRVRPSGV